MKVALTGSSGFIGSAILCQLQEANIDTLILSRASGFDLKSFNFKVVKDFAPEIIIHSAWAGADNIQRNDPELLDLNFTATLQLFKQGVDSGCRRFISFGSQAEYSAGFTNLISETDPTKPSSAYGKTKIDLCAALQEAAYKSNIEFVWLRLFTCYGNQQPPSYLLPHLINALSNGIVPEIQTPQAVWDYLHVDDMAKAMLLFTYAQSVNGIFNLASGVGISVGELSRLVANILDLPKAKTSLLEKELEKVDVAQFRIADITKITNNFNWRPEISISEGITKMCAMRAFLNPD